MPYKDAEKRREYQRSNKDRINAYHREYYMSHKYIETRKDYYLENKEKYSESSKRWYSNPINKILRLEKIHGINYQQILEDQDGKCPICLYPLEGTRTHIDHNHITGQVRGILHHQCNTSLGVFKDDPEILDRAASYLRENKNYGTSKFKSRAHPKISSYKGKVQNE